MPISGFEIHDELTNPNNSKYPEYLHLDRQIWRVSIRRPKINLTCLIITSKTKRDSLFSTGLKLFSDMSNPTVTSEVFKRQQIAGRVLL